MVYDSSPLRGKPHFCHQKGDQVMNDHVDTAISEAETDARSKPRGARDRFFCLVAGSKGTVVELVKASTLEEAMESFKEKHGRPANITMDGEGSGYYIAKGTGKSDAQRISVTVTPAQLQRRTTASFRAQFRGWNVYASGLSACNIDGVDYADNDLVAIEFDTLIGATAENRKELMKLNPKPKLKKREVVPLSNLQNVERS